MNASCDLLPHALAQVQAGNLAEARRVCREILDTRPDDDRALHLLGLIAHRLGDDRQAVALLKRSLAGNPANSECLVNLGEVYRCSGRLEEAVESCRSALELQPENTAALNNLAKACKALGRFEEAAAGYQQALEIDPDFAEAWNNLGNVRLCQGWHDEAADCFRHCLRLNPEMAEAWNNLGVAMAQRRNLEEARRCYEQALALKPGFLEALKNLGIAFGRENRDEEAAGCFARIHEEHPDHEEAFWNLGESYAKLQRLEEAEHAFRRGLAAHPDSTDLLSSLGLLLTKRFKLDEAEDCFRRALQIDRRSSEIWNNLGITLAEQSRWERAADCFRQAACGDVDTAKAWANLSLVQQYQGKISESIASCEKALALDPDYAKGHHNLGLALKDQGRLDEAIGSMKRGVQASPDDPTIQSALLMTQQYAPERTAEHLRRDAVAWAASFANPIPQFPVAANPREPEKRLRIGYVSGDLRRHPVGYFLEPVLAAHDRSRFEIFCYANQAIDDDLSARLQGLADGWHRAAGLTDEELANLIRHHGVDILVDLSGHTDRHRLGVFTRRPAPVQATWLGYFSTTGLPTIDYLIACDHLVPAGADRHYVETVLRLPGNWFCYQPPEPDVPVTPSPALSHELVTFGSFNNIAKVTPEVIHVWSEILHAVPDSRLFLKSLALGDEGTRARLEDRFAQAGVDPQRLRLEGRSPREEMHAALAEVDIALDPFPFNGAATTIETLWMGVPVVTLAGTDKYVSRMGASILASAGLEEFITRTPQDYIQNGARLAGDLQVLDDLRQDIRRRLLQSPLCDTAGFTAGLENLYREMWRHWCGSNDLRGD